MTDAWFAQSLGRWFSLLLLLALLSLLRPLADRGQHRRVVLSLFGACAIVGGLLLASGVGAVLAGAFVKMRQAYLDADIRRTIASDL